MDIGIIVQLQHILENGIESILELGLNCCQINCWNMELYTRENAEKLKEIVKDKVKITSLWAGWSPPAVWNFIDGPLTLGLVPREYRAQRIKELKKGADFANMLGITDVTTHMGFIPENPATTEYRETVIAIREVASYCKRYNLYLNFETGQETPVTLMRTIEDVGLDNLGVNLDPANLLLYGKANPVDAVDIYKEKIRGIHVKDGMYPTDGRNLGKEMPVGEGLVNFPELIKKLLSYGYKGPYIIEREISGPQQRIDIIKARDFLIPILGGYSKLNPNR
ncbi:MAG: sugar phosphate isomerase/epimerase [Firmicutes bacterium]|nr:sugar phosphate isomerase/epimerase [Bacillota bacterium]